MKNALPVDIRCAESGRDFDRLFRFRYQVYVEEMNRPQQYADHRRKRIAEPLDEGSTQFIATKGDEIVGCLRWTSGAVRDFDEYADYYAMDVAGPYFPQRCSISTKFMVAPAYRRSSIATSLSIASYRFGASAGSAFDFIDCNPHLERMFSRYGYRSYRGRIDHHEYGDVLPMVLVLLDHDHLRAVRSLFSASAAEHPPDVAASRYFYDHIHSNQKLTCHAAQC